MFKIESYPGPVCRLQSQQNTWVWIGMKRGEVQAGGMKTESEVQFHLK